MVNVALVIFMIIAIILLFVSMVLSAMAASEASKGSDKCKANCHKYSMWSALVSGIAVAVIVVALIIYIYTSRHHVMAAAAQLLQTHGVKLSKMGAKGKSVQILT